MKKFKSPFFKLYIFLTLLFFFYLFLFFYFFFSDDKKVCYVDTCFNVELANTDLEKKEGLMFRDYLWENEWMLFLYSEEDIYSFWMKNTKIPLDLIWIDSNFSIVDMVTLFPCENTENCKIYSPKYPAKYVLEINAWNIDNLDIKTWSFFDFDI